MFTFGNRLERFHTKYRHRIGIQKNTEKKCQYHKNSYWIKIGTSQTQSMTMIIHFHFYNLLNIRKTISRVSMWPTLLEKQEFPETKESSCNIKP